MVLLTNDTLTPYLGDRDPTKINSFILHTNY